MSAGTRSSAMTAHGAGVLGDPRLLGVRDVHDDAALEHLGETALDPHGADFEHRHDCSGRDTAPVRIVRTQGLGCSASAGPRRPPSPRSARSRRALLGHGLGRASEPRQLRGAGQGHPAVPHGGERLARHRVFTARVQARVRLRRSRLRDPNRRERDDGSERSLLRRSASSATTRPGVRTSPSRRGAHSAS